MTISKQVSRTDISSAPTCLPKTRHWCLVPSCTLIIVLALSQQSGFTSARWSTILLTLAIIQRAANKTEHSTVRAITNNQSSFYSSRTHHTKPEKKHTSAHGSPASQISKCLFLGSKISAVLLQYTVKSKQQSHTCVDSDLLSLHYLVLTSSQHFDWWNFKLCCHQVTTSNHNPFSSNIIVQFYSETDAAKTLFF